MLVRFVFLTIFVVTATGCINHYRYESPGTVRNATGAQVNALLYWYGDDGRLWYGKHFQQIDSGVTMLVCGTTSKSFDGGAAGQELRILSRAGDRLVQQDNGVGNLAPLAEPQNIAPGGTCGKISLTGSGVPSAALLPGNEPDVVVLCDNPRRPDRYPASGIYRFGSISRTLVADREAPGDVCAAGGGVAR